MTIQYNSNYIETLPFSDVCKQFNLSSTVAQSWTVPGNATQKYQAYFEYNQSSNVFVCKNGTAASPASGTNTSQQYNEFRPKKRYVQGGDVLSLITPDTNAYVGISLRQLQG